MPPIQALLPLAALLSIAVPSLQVGATGSDESRTPSDAARTDAQHRGDPRTEGPHPESPHREGLVRLRIGGHLEGRLEPCGCAGGQIGGLSRRVSNLLLDRAAYDLLLEGGNLVKGGTPLDDYKLLTTTTVLGDPRATYAAVGLGPDDLKLSPDTLLPYLDFGVPFVGCDLVFEAQEEGLPDFPLRPFVDHVVDGTTVRITGFVGAAPVSDSTPEEPETPREGAEDVEEPSYRATLLDPTAGWARAMAGVDGSAIRIAFIHRDEMVGAVAKLEPKPHLLIVSTKTHAEPPASLDEAEGVPVCYPGTRGRLLVDVHLRHDGETVDVESYRPFPLDGTLRDEATDAAILQHRFDVAEADLLQEMAESRPTPEGVAYVADEQVCASCHYQEMQVWKNSKHATAWKTLEEAEEGEKYGWPVTEYPDCVSCHSVGYGEETGFIDIEQTPTLASVRCQSCHGPASAHLAANDKKQGFSRDPIQSCQTCHDFEQSPDWDYRKRWPVIEHGRK